MSKPIVCTSFLVMVLVACGSNEAPAPEPGSGSAAPAAAPAPAPAPAPPADTSPVGPFGAFVLAINTIASDGQCFEFGGTDRNGGPVREADARRLATDMLHAPPAAISSTRCPPADRLSGGCAINMLNGVNRYYGAGPHAMTAESARTHCEQNMGRWIE